MASMQAGRGMMGRRGMGGMYGGAAMQPQPNAMDQRNLALPAVTHALHLVLEYPPPPLPSCAVLIVAMLCFVF